jgi:hypothetical protein
VPALSRNRRRRGATQRDPLTGARRDRAHIGHRPAEFVVLAVFRAVTHAARRARDSGALGFEELLGV